MTFKTFRIDVKNFIQDKFELDIQERSLKFPVWHCIRADRMKSVLPGEQ